MMNFDECVKFVKEYIKHNPIYYSESGKEKPELLELDKAFSNLAFYNASTNTTTFFQKDDFVTQINDFVNSKDVDTLVLTSQVNTALDRKESIKLTISTPPDDVDISGLLQAVKYYNGIGRLVIYNIDKTFYPNEQTVIGYDSGKIYIKFNIGDSKSYISPMTGVTGVTIRNGSMIIDLSDWEVEVL